MDTYLLKGTGTVRVFILPAKKPDDMVLEIKFSTRNLIDVCKYNLIIINIICY